MVSFAEALNRCGIPWPDADTDKARQAADAWRALASAAESKQMLAKHAQIREQLKGPFLIVYSAKTKTEAAAEEAEEAATEEGVAAMATAPGTALEAKPGKLHAVAPR